jgi:hypothetical protein
MITGRVNPSLRANNSDLLLVGAVSENNVPPSRKRNRVLSMLYKSD